MNISNTLTDDLRLGSAAERQARRITLVVSGLGCGGIQRSVVAISGGLAQRGHQVSLITLFGPELDFFSTPERVQRLSLGCSLRPAPLLALPSKLRRRMQRLRALVAVTRPEVVIAHAPQINVQTLMACRDYPTIVTEHGDVSLYTGLRARWPWRKAGWYAMRRLTYARACKVVSVSRAVDANVSWLALDRRSIVHNPLTVTVARGAEPLPPGADPDRPWLVSVGRLAHAKGMDLLLSAFARIANRFPEWQLIIVGDGDLRAALEAQANPLRGQVAFVGALRDPLPLVRRAEWFVMASRYEGFPIAPGEALLCGVPVIATDCPSRPRRAFESAAPAGGIRELFSQGLGGVLVPNEDTQALADTLARCMADPLLRRRLAAETPRVTERFSLECVLNEWEALVQEVSPIDLTGAHWKDGLRS